MMPSSDPAADELRNKNLNRNSEDSLPVKKEENPNTINEDE